MARQTTKGFVVHGIDRLNNMAHTIVFKEEPGEASLEFADGELDFWVPCHLWDRRPADGSTLNLTWNVGRWELVSVED